MFDPRTKLILTFYCTILIVVSHRLTILGTEGGALLLFIISIGEFKNYLRWLRLVIPMSLFFGAVTWWSVNADAGAVAALRLLILTTVFFSFFACTVPEDLANSLVKTGVPFTVAFVLSAGLNFVPVIGRKARDVLDAQRARGIPLEPGWRALRHYPAFLGPLLIQAFQLAEDLAEAMETRGFGYPGRTFLKTYQLRFHDWLVISAGFIILAGFILIRLLRF
ncbi:energy-coupling factor transporter transmembrane component T [Desulfococcaceae bacterium HSG9]|nr:energy-coupling factor transporter transmembrane component T [Desulfococcaceae bacterium HSG9]